MFDIFDEDGYVGEDKNNQYSYYSGGFRSTASEDRRESGSSKSSADFEEEEPIYTRSYGRKKSHGFGSLIAKAACLGLVFGLVASGVMFGFNKVTGGLQPQKSEATQETAIAASPVSIVQTAPSSVSTSDANDVSDIVDEVMPSVVAVDTTIEATTMDWFGRQYRQEGQGAGSGFIISSNENELYIITNYHVIEDSKKVDVKFFDDSTAEATVRGSQEMEDIAVLEVKVSDLSEETKDKIKVAVIGDSDTLRVGSSAIAIGNALGYGQSVTTGVISATSRELQLTDKTMTLIQTSAAINPGNSGGALLNGKGEVIGINTVKYSDTDVEGMGYAIPINSAIETAKGIIEGTVSAKTDEESAYLGIIGGTVDEETAEKYGIPQGVYVSSVVSGSAADRAGLEAGCIISAMDGEEMTSMDDLQAAIEKRSPGDSVELTVQFPDNKGENYSEKKLTTILGAKSDDDYSESNDSNDYNSNSGRDNYFGSYGSDDFSIYDFFMNPNGGGNNYFR